MFKSRLCENDIEEVGKIYYQAEGKRTLSSVMMCVFVKELLLSSSPWVVRVVSLGRSSSKESEEEMLRMMRVLLLHL